MSLPASTVLLSASRTAVALSFKMCSMRPGSRSKAHSSEGQFSGELGGVLEDEDKSDKVEVGEQLSDGWAARHRSGFQPTLRKGSEQVNQNRIISTPGIQQNVEKALVRLVRRQLTLYALDSCFRLVLWLFGTRRHHDEAG
jgi:hypothetical protein